MPTGIDVSKDTEKKMVEAYTSGKTSKEAAALFGLSPGACLLALRRAGVRARAHSQAARLYDFDFTFFDVIDTAQKAYWLGFITADGCVQGNRLQITLAEKDRAHLETFKAHIRGEMPLCSFDGAGRNEGRRYTCISLSSAHTTSALRQLGVVERKTWCAVPWCAPQHHLATDYWRGLVDGDGGVCSTKPRVYLCGTLGIVGAFIEWAGSNAVPQKRGSIYTTEVGGSRVGVNLARRLYENASVALPRKKLIAEKWYQALS